jgi:hypothetical protein
MEAPIEQVKGLGALVHMLVAFLARIPGVGPEWHELGVCCDDESTVGV